MIRVRSLLTITLVPERVSKPSLPVVMGIVRITAPSRSTCASWVAASTFVTMDGPILNEDSRPPLP
ncbi:unannotated protein [freshwater metagenome]|uniref:Unannotated protein n=1 Tax=freshwater metagenome TaxID=449393 RepID=A0A6J6TQ55_9ZZZZ